MSEQEPEDTQGISDDQLPADVRPEEDNPLARHPEQTGDKDDEIGADTEGEADTAPLTEEDSEYGHPGEGSA
jgi:hypothetical protein